MPDIQSRVVFKITQIAMLKVYHHPTPSPSFPPPSLLPSFYLFSSIQILPSSQFSTPVDIYPSYSYSYPPPSSREGGTSLLSSNILNFGYFRFFLKNLGSLPGHNPKTGFNSHLLILHAKPNYFSTPPLTLPLFPLTNPINESIPVFFV